MKVSSLDCIQYRGIRYRGLIVWFADDKRRPEVSNAFVVRGFGGWNVAKDLNVVYRGWRSECRLKQTRPAPKSLEAL